MHHHDFLNQNAFEYECKKKINIFDFHANNCFHVLSSISHIVLGKYSLFMSKKLTTYTKLLILL